MKRILFRFVLLSFSVILSSCATSKIPESAPLVLMTDFGLRDGAVSSMKGVAYTVEKSLVVSDLSHEIPPYNIWEAAYRLQQTYEFWPPGTVFVTVVDPGVGSDRKSIVVRSNSGHYFVGPDNGLFTLVADNGGIQSARVISEAQRRRAGSEESYTFHGRDVYVFVGAQLAAGQLQFESIGQELPALTRLEYQRADYAAGEMQGVIPVLDPNYGNVWSNIPKAMVTKHFNNRQKFHVTIFDGQKQVYAASLPLVDTFSGVMKGKPLLYFNSLLNLSLALNQGDFARKFKIGSGPNWRVRVRGD